MSQWIGPASVQIMACRLFGAKPSSKPTLFFVNCALRSKLKWNLNQNIKNFHSWKPIRKYLLRNGGHFVRGDELILNAPRSLDSHSEWYRCVSENTFKPRVQLWTKCLTLLPSLCLQFIISLQFISRHTTMTKFGSVYIRDWHFKD